MLFLFAPLFQFCCLGGGTEKRGAVHSLSYKPQCLSISAEVCSHGACPLVGEGGCGVTFRGVRLGPGPTPKGGGEGALPSSAPGLCLGILAVSPAPRVLAVSPMPGDMPSTMAAGPTSGVLAACPTTTEGFCPWLRVCPHPNLWPEPWPPYHCLHLPSWSRSPVPGSMGGSVNRVWVGMR